jgi:hypothetical protein
MACPYFDPVQPQPGEASEQTAMLPLGDAWMGVCRADPREPKPAEDRPLHPSCNLGYARGGCERFPRQDGPDAVRFTIADDAGDRIRVWYAVESAHYPFAHGWLDYSRQDRCFAAAPESPLLVRQAGAYVASYLRRKDEAETR